MPLIEVSVAPLVALLFDADMGQHTLHAGADAAAGHPRVRRGGVVFSAALLRARSRDTLLASLLYPVVVPIFLAGAKGTSQLLDPATAGSQGAVFWTQFLVAADVIFIAVGLWAFEPVVTGE